MAAVPSSLVPLESGDRLTRAEFHRRYCARPDIAKAELVQGVVYVASPTRFSRHARPHRPAIAWLDAHATRTPGVELGIEATIFLGTNSEVRPDICLFRTLPSSRVQITDDDYLEGAPDLVFEIAASSASYDLHDKLEAYRRAGVPEYAVWRVLDRAINWFRLREGAYLRLDVPAMLAEDRAAVLGVLQPSD
ncbi:MAG: Uma2 family endonuclease [Chloroflexota bacterium]